jgi:hypothetical protein
VLCGETGLLVSWCAGDRCGMVGSDEDRGSSRRLGVGDWGWSNTGRVLSGRTIERSGDTMCGLHSAQGDGEREFLCLATKSWSVSFPVWASNRQLRFGDLAHKIITSVSWFGPQNQAGYGLSVAPQNRWKDEDGVGHASKSRGLLRL